MVKTAVRARDDILSPAPEMTTWLLSLTRHLNGDPEEDATCPLVIALEHDFAVNLGFGLGLGILIFPCAN